MTTAIFKKIVAAVIVAFVILGIVIFGQPGHLVPFVLILIASVVLAAFLFLLPEGLLKQAVTERKFLIARVLCLVVALAALVKAGLMMQPPTTAEEGMVIGHQSSDAFEDAETFQTSDSVVEAATPALAVEVAFSAAVMEAYSEGQDLYDEGNFEEAYPLFLKAAEAGHSNAQLYAGKCLQEDIDVDDGAMPAAYWFGLSANQGNDAAEYELGRCYYAGDGVERDVDKAFEWFVQAAQRDNANGMLWVGYFYHHGISVEQDYDMALQYYQAAKDHGHTYAQRRIDELLAERNS